MQQLSSAPTTEAHADHAARAETLLAGGELEAAQNIISRFAVSPRVKARVQLANEKFSDAATSFFEAGELEAAAASAVLEPWNSHQLLRQLVSRTALSDLVGLALALTPLPRDSVSRIAAALPATIKVPVARAVSEYNVLVISRLAYSLQFATLVPYIDPTLELQDLIASMILDNKLDASIDQVRGLVLFAHGNQNTQQELLQAFYDNVENLSRKIDSQQH